MSRFILAAAFFIGCILTAPYALPNPAFNSADIICLLAPIGFVYCLIPRRKRGRSR